MTAPGLIEYHVSYHANVRPVAWPLPERKPDDTPARRSMRSILDEVAAKYGLTVEQLRSHGQPGDRDWYVAHPRQEAMWMMWQQEHLSLPRIGRFLGGRDHTTILHGCRAHEKRMAEGKV